MRKTMATIKPGDAITLRFYTWGGDSYTETALFVEERETADGQYKTFESLDDRGRKYRWEAYRYEGFWAYGSSAQRVTVTQD